MDTFPELTSFFSNPSPSFKRWIQRRSVLEAWTSCTYLWWTVNETRSALFSIKWGLRQNWVYDIWSRRRKVSRRNLVGDSPTEQFLRSRGLRQKQTVPHLVSQPRKTTWGSLLEYSLTEQIISSNIVSSRPRKNVLPFVRVYHEEISDRNCFFSYIILWYYHVRYCLFFFIRWLFFTTLFVSAKLRLHSCQLKSEEKLITNVVVAFHNIELNQLRQTSDALDASSSFQWPAVWKLHKGSAWHRQALEENDWTFYFYNWIFDQKKLLSPARKCLLF